MTIPTKLENDSSGDSFSKECGEAKIFVDRKSADESLISLSDNIIKIKPTLIKHVGHWYFTVT